MVPDVEQRIFAWGVWASEPPDGVVLIVAARDLDYGTEMQARRELHELIARGNASAIWLYLGEHAFVDTRGLHVLIDASRRARAAGQRLRVLAAPRSLRRMLALVGLDGQLNLHDDLWDPAEMVV